MSTDLSTTPFRLHKCGEDVHTALCDSVDTKTSLECLRELITATNIYLDSRRKENKMADRGLLRNAAMYVTRMLKVRADFTMVIL